MSQGIDSLAELTLDAAFHVDDTCDRFESEFRAGAKPRIEDYLAGQIEPLRSSLLIELIKLESQLRSKVNSDQTLAIEEYRERFRDDQPLVDEVLKELTEPQSPAAVPTATFPEEFVLPFQLGVYRLDAQIGQGGMGTVYQAVHQALDRKVALKLMSRTRMRNADAVARFQREMKAVARLHHPGIVMAHDAGEVDGTHFLVMEYVTGWDLASISRCFGPLPMPVACECIRQVAIGLQHAHEHGLVHRDIKPSNLMLTREGQIKILDLGLARLRENEQDERLTNDAMPMGTLEYMAPEQARNPHGVEIRADLYSLGCTLFKLLSGYSPFGRIPRTTIQLLTAHLESPAPDIRDCCEGVPDPLAVLINRLLKKSPHDRPQTPLEVEQALAEFASPSLLNSFADAAMEISDSNGKLPENSVISAEAESNRWPQPAKGLAVSIVSDVDPDREGAQATRSPDPAAAAQPATPRRAWAICLSVATLLVAVAVIQRNWTDPAATSLLRSADSNQVLVGEWKVEPGSAVSPTEGPGCLKLTPLKSAGYQVDLSVHAIEGSLRWMIVSTAEPQFSIQFRPDLVVADATTSADDEALVPPNWRGDWGDYSDPAERNFRVIVRNGHLTLYRDNAIIRDEPITPGTLSGSLPDAAATVPGLYLLTEHSSLRFRDARLIRLNP